MAQHRLLARSDDVDVLAPAQGQVLMGNGAGAWEGMALGDVAGSFGSPAALTAALTTVTIVAPGTPDYAIADVTNTSPFGFVGAEEARTVLSVIRNLQLRLAEVEAKLRAVGMVT
jgi:hypothetical protein